MSSKSKTGRDDARGTVAPSMGKRTDAGMRDLDHYEHRLPHWRFWLRQQLIPIVRWETPLLARMQQTCRSPFLDSYFALTANLGTHTFFMIALPICFWCGYPNMGITLVHILALGVYLSGVVKDLVCLPRPSSPPLQRITMSGSAALEYGFPSTHTTNAVSVAVYCLYTLWTGREHYSDAAYVLLCAGSYCYAASITLGRVYCGMHGIFDVVVGGLLGALIAWIRITYGTDFDDWILGHGWTHPALASVLLVLAVIVHPEPADNCPCFDDSVAFIGVVMGIGLGGWHYAQTANTSTLSSRSLVERYTFENHDLRFPVARVLLGIATILIWRAVAKPALLHVLPPLFRFIDRWGLSIPRRYFLQSKEYLRVPPLRRDDNVIPTVSEIPNIISSLRKPRTRAVSIGPQSEADARELIASRERNSVGDKSAAERSGEWAKADESPAEVSRHSIPQPNGASDSAICLTTPALQAKPQHYLRTSALSAQPLTPPPSDGSGSSESGHEDEPNHRVIFSQLEKPRVRYDVEVATKLVVYTGIAWLAVEGNPLLFATLRLT